MTLGCHRRLPTPIGQACDSMSPRGRGARLRDRGRPGEPAHPQAEPEQQTACRNHEDEIEARERKASVSVALRLRSVLRRRNDAAGVVATAAAVLDLRLDDAA